MEAQRTPLTVELARRTLAEALASGDREDLAPPILAGMRARAVADACDDLGLAAILIDGTARVLHVGRHAAAQLGGTFDVVSGHLVGRNPAANRAVQTAVTEAIGRDVEASAQPDDAAVTGLRYRDPSPVQLLQGILVLGDRDRARSGIAALRDALAA